MSGLPAQRVMSEIVCSFCTSFAASGVENEDRQKGMAIWFARLDNGRLRPMCDSCKQLAKMISQTMLERGFPPITEMRMSARTAAGKRSVNYTSPMSKERITSFVSLDEGMDEFLVQEVMGS